MADWSWVKPVGEFVVNLFGSISKSSQEKKAKKQEQNMAESQIPDGQYLGVDGILYPINAPLMTRKSIERKRSEFGGSVDWSKYESMGKNDLGEDLFRVKVRVAAQSGTGKKSNNIFGGIVDAANSLLNGSAGADSKNPSPVTNIVSQVFKPVNLILLGGAGYGIWYYFSKSKKVVR